MAAVLAPHQPPADPRLRVVTSRPVAGRPPLRVIRGGRDPRVMAATYRRRRVVAALLLVTVVVVGLQLLSGAVELAGEWSAPTSRPVEGPAVVVEAREGDTVWSLAQRVHPGADVRPVVEAIVADRGSASLQPGDEVRIPAG